MPQQINEAFDLIINKGQTFINKASGITRDYEDKILEAMSSRPIKVITGFRRVGKSTLVRQVCQQLVKRQQFCLTDILYLNFEDLDLEEFNTAKKVKKVCDYFLERSRPKKARVLFVFDEIQLIADWSKLVRTIYEFEDQVEIVITGSNSELLSSEIGTNLAGRFINFEIQSFSFKEYLAFHACLPKSKAAFVKNQRKIKKLFIEDYLCFGGLPEHFSIKTAGTKLSYLQGIVSKVILDDVIQRFKIRNPIVIEKIVIYLLINTGNRVSFANIEKHLKNLGFDVKQETVTTYVSYLCKAFAIFELAKMDWKSRKVFASSKKYYASDPGLAYLYNDLAGAFSATALENVVYLKLKRDKSLAALYYGDSEQEIDFIVLDKQTQLFSKYQVSAELNDKNRERELSSLINSDYYTQNPENYLLLLDADREDIEIREPAKTTLIKQRNLLEWLLDL